MNDNIVAKLLGKTSESSPPWLRHPAKSGYRQEKGRPMVSRRHQRHRRRQNSDRHFAFIENQTAQLELIKDGDDVIHSWKNDG